MASPAGYFMPNLRSVLGRTGVPEGAQVTAS